MVIFILFILHPLWNVILFFTPYLPIFFKSSVCENLRNGKLLLLIRNHLLWNEKKSQCLYRYGVNNANAVVREKISFSFLIDLTTFSFVWFERKLWMNLFLDMGGKNMQKIVAFSFLTLHYLLYLQHWFIHPFRKYKNSTLEWVNEFAFVCDHNVEWLQFLCSIENIWIIFRNYIFTHTAKK